MWGPSLEEAGFGEQAPSETYRAALGGSQPLLESSRAPCSVSLEKPFMLLGVPGRNAQPKPLLLSSPPTQQAGSPAALPAPQSSSQPPGCHLAVASTWNVPPWTFFLRAGSSQHTGLCSVLLSPERPSRSPLPAIPWHHHHRPPTFLLVLCVSPPLASAPAGAVARLQGSLRVSSLALRDAQ